MPANKRLTDLTDYKSVLPYASELFGVYQPLIGWKSKRRLRKIKASIDSEIQVNLVGLGDFFQGSAKANFNADHQMEDGGIAIAGPKEAVLRGVGDSVLFTEIQKRLGEEINMPQGDTWKSYVGDEALSKLLSDVVYPAYKEEYSRRERAGRGFPGFDFAKLQAEIVARLKDESKAAGVITTFMEKKDYGTLGRLFFSPKSDPTDFGIAVSSALPHYEDPFEKFDPKRDIDNVSLSPLGIVHLFRQFFFELDSFVGTPVGHVWLSPGSTVELIEVSTRRELVEKTIETALETTSKEEKSTTDQDEISEAVKQDNKDDTKLGFSTTVNQSWGTGNATATGSLDLSKTQDTAREQQHKRSREQSEKLSTEIRQNFKSTFKTVTETTDTSSKRYVLNNTTQDLVNYELRRKMRQVGVQVQDVGTYLCWETFVDEPGRQLSLANLIHLAKPADLILVPNPKLIAMPPLTVGVSFTGEAVWNFPNNDRQYNTGHPETHNAFVPLATLDIPGIPNDYEIAFDPANPFIDVQKTVVAAEDDDSWSAANWGFRGLITPDGKRVIVGVVVGPGGLAWDDRITFSVSGALTCRLMKSKQDEINAANDALISTKAAADAENQRRLEQAYLDSVKERVTLASKVQKRKFENLREEERTIVYRNLIKALMSEKLYKQLPDNAAGFQSRHVLSELINAIFDIDKMLYFVAPEWWKPRAVASLVLGGKAIPGTMNGMVVRWADDAEYGKYFITDESEPAPLGSSLGWLLQLDGDDMRNAFLNAPWVKAVIPVRPGKEKAAINWLQNVGVEGSDGLDAAYSGPQDELDKIRASLLAVDANDPVKDHDRVTIGDAVRNLCHEVAMKHDLSNTVGRYPEDEIDDASRVSSTPVEKVFEHGFYPLKGGFKAKSEEPFEVCAQWIEVMPTDQVVPVPVKYDAKTGRQI
jgi:hypothetical protein